MMPNELPCHQSCSDLLEKQIWNSVCKIYGNNVKVQPVVFQDRLRQQQENGIHGAFTHRFMVTVVEQCQQEEIDVGGGLQSNPEDDIIIDASCLEDFLQGNDDVKSVSWKPDELMSPRATFMDALENVGINEQFAEAPVHSDDSLDLSFFENCVEADAGTLVTDVFQASIDTWNDGLYPLSTETLHTTINEQLDKAPAPATPENLSNSLFKDIYAAKDATPQPQDTDVATATNQHDSSSTAVMMVNQFNLSEQQQQSTEISSSWETTLSTANCQTSAMIPDNSYYSSTATSLDFVGQTPQFLCPANLPAVSSLIQAGGNGGSSMNWTLSCVAAPGGANKATILRLAKQKQVRNGHARPSMLLPKPVPSASSNTTTESATTQTLPFTPVKARLRSRKTSPSLKAPTVNQTTVSQFTDSRPVGAPNGHTFESWIIQEGLIKIREQLKLEKRQDKNLDLSQRQNGKSKKAQKSRKDAQPKAAKKARFICPICGKAYGSANGIRYHAENGHGPKMSFTCNICDKEYGSRHGLAAHQRTHEIQAVAEALEKDKEQQTSQQQ